MRRLVIPQEQLRLERQARVAEEARLEQMIALEVENARKAHAERKSAQAALAVYQTKEDPTTEAAIASLPFDHSLREQLRVLDRKVPAVRARMRKVGREYEAANRGRASA